MRCQQLSDIFFEQGGEGLIFPDDPQSAADFEDGIGFEVHFDAIGDFKSDDEAFIFEPDITVSQRFSGEPGIFGNGNDDAPEIGFVGAAFGEFVCEGPHGLDVKFFVRDVVGLFEQRA